MLCPCNTFFLSSQEHLTKQPPKTHLGPALFLGNPPQRTEPAPDPCQCSPSPSRSSCSPPAPNSSRTELSNTALPSSLSGPACTFPVSPVFFLPGLHTQELEEIPRGLSHRSRLHPSPFWQVLSVVSPRFVWPSINVPLGEKTQGIPWTVSQYSQQNLCAAPF